MEKNNLFFWLIAFASGAMTAFISRLWFLLNNPSEVFKTPDGKVHWKFEFVYGAVETIIGGFIGLGVIKLVLYFELVDDMMLAGLAGCMFSTVAGKIFTMLQNKALKVATTLDKKTDGMLEDEEI